jgi:autotransporter-associated beta strand protein
MAYVWIGYLDYNYIYDWSPGGAPPVAAGEAAIFDSSGSYFLTVSSGPIAPDSWTFNPDAQSYVIGGAAVNFGTVDGLSNQANSGQSISISNDLGGIGAVNQIGNSGLTLSGANTYSGGTVISSGTLTLGHVDPSGNIDAAGTGEIDLAGGTLQFSTNGTLNNKIALTGSATITGSVTIAGQFQPGAFTLTFGTVQFWHTLEFPTGGTIVFAPSSLLAGAFPSINVNGAALVAGAGNSALGTLTANAPSTTVGSYSWLDFNGNSATIANLQGTEIPFVYPGGEITNAAGATTTIISGSFEGRITGAGDVVFGSPGSTVNLGNEGNPNTYTGGTTINGTQVH